MKTPTMEDNCSETIQYSDKTFHCSLAFALHLIGDKYKSLIIYHLQDGAMRSGVLQKSIKDISSRMFTYSIRALEKDKLVKRTVFPTSPPHVEYELTEIGKSLIPIILDLNKWGKDFATDHHLYAPAE